VLVSYRKVAAFVGATGAVPDTNVTPSTSFCPATRPVKPAAEISIWSSLTTKPWIRSTPSFDD
jgi:hypothetical protein